MFKNKFVLVLIVVSVVVPLVSYLLNVYTDWLFFLETGFAPVFLTTMYAKTGAWFLFAWLLFLFLQANLYVANRMRFPRSGLNLVGGWNFRISGDEAALLRQEYRRSRQVGGHGFESGTGYPGQGGDEHL